MSNSIQNKLFHFEAEPPASAWEAIDAALDKDSLSFPAKLYHFQQQPPAVVWQKIENKLDVAETKPAVKVIPLYRLPKALKYAAAAVVLLFIGLSVNYFISNRSASDVASAPGTETLLNTTIPPIPSMQPVPKAQAPAVSEQDQLAVNEPQTENKKLAVHKTKSSHAQKQPVHYAPSVELPHTAPETKELSVVPKEKPTINTQAADRYMLATSNTGQVVRLPKKAYSDYACADDPLIASNKSCKEQISLLQQQMTASMATDFTQLLDLLKNLQENR